MAEYKVSISQNKFKVTTERTIVAENLSDLADVSVSNLPAKDKYVLTYDATSKKYTLVPADQVLQTAAEDTVLPQEFVDQLDIQLDDKIDVDGGEF